jgi:hypothetical protein
MSFVETVVGGTFSKPVITAIVKNSNDSTGKQSAEPIDANLAK